MMHWDAATTLSARRGKHQGRKVWWIYAGSKRTTKWFSTHRRARRYINRWMLSSIQSTLPNSPKAGMSASVHRSMQGGPGEDVGSEWFQYRDDVASHAARYAVDQYHGIRRPPSKASLDYTLYGAPRHLQRALSLVSREAQRGATDAIHRNYDDASAVVAGRVAGRRVSPPRASGPRGETIAEITERRRAKKAARGRPRYVQAKAKANSAALAAATTIAVHMLTAILMAKGEAFLGSIQGMSIEERKEILRKFGGRLRYLPAFWAVKKLLKATGKDEATLDAVAHLIGDPIVQQAALNAAQQAADASNK